MADVTEKLGEIIPSFYYDLVARILPGTATIVAILWAVRYPLANVKSTTQLGDGVLLVIFLGCGYISGLLLTTIAATIFGTSAWVLGKFFQRLKQYSDSYLWLRIDKLDKKNPKAGATLSKMAAEVTLCQNLLAGSVIVLAISNRCVPVHWAAATLILLGFTVAHRVVVLSRRLDSLEQ